VELLVLYEKHQRDLVAAFGRFQLTGMLEIITSAATHALLPLLADHPPSLCAQVLVGRDHYRSCFGQDPVGIWLPECAYAEPVERALRDAGLRWFIVDTHGLLQANPRPVYAVFAPVFTPSGLAAFGRDHASAKQVWSRNEGYPGDPRYRDFYRDIGFDLELDYLWPHLASPPHRGFTGVKYHRITGSEHKAFYERASALQAVQAHAEHFFQARQQQLQQAAAAMDRPPLLVCPYDAELFGHWWYEGPEFLDAFVRRVCASPGVFELATPAEYLRKNPTHQVAAPAASSWGEEGYWRVWLNEENAWVYPHLRAAQERMSQLVNPLAGQLPALPASRRALRHRALKQAGRELLLAQASDWPFILRTATSPGYARQRIKDHLLQFGRLHQQITQGTIDETTLTALEERDNLFPDLNYRYWG
jgi:1,4-alpha-glucan branching enzyme